MNVVMIGFSSVRELDNVMQRLIAASQCFLFTVLVTSFGGTAYIWAKENGAPVSFIKGSMEEIIKEADYLVAKFDGSSAMRLLINRWRETGKHGTVIDWSN